MKLDSSRWQVIPLVLAMAALLLAAGCADKARRATGKLDTPEHHTLRGNDFLDEGRWNKAERSFDLALSLDKEYSQAISGKAIVVGHKAGQAQASPDAHEQFAEKAEDLVKSALDEAKNEDDERIAQTAGIRVKRLAKYPADDWLEDAEDFYAEATELDERRLDPRPHFYMARAYRDAFALTKAQDLYRKVLGMNRGKTREADDELALLQKIIRAEPGTVHGKVIAFEPDISRADMAALFLGELRLKNLYARGAPSRFDTGFKAAGPKKFQADRLQRAPEATDIKTHPLRSDIEEVMKLRVLGLQPDPAHKFHPNAKVTRAEFAIMVEDILVKVTGETKLKTRFIGQVSPFADVRNDVPYFNAVQTVVSRALMEPKNKIRGEFGPMNPVTGADALLVIRQMKSELQSYLRQS